MRHYSSSHKQQFISTHTSVVKVSMPHRLEGSVSSTILVFHIGSNGASGSMDMRRVCVQTRLPTSNCLNVYPLAGSVSFRRTVLSICPSSEAAFDYLTAVSLAKKKSSVEMTPCCTLVEASGTSDRPHNGALSHAVRSAQTSTGARRTLRSQFLSYSIFAEAKRFSVSSTAAMRHGFGPQLCICNPLPPVD